MSELPSEWCEAAINHIAEVFLGKTPARADYQSTGKLKVIKFRDLRNGRIDFQNPKNGFVHDNGSVIPGLRELRPNDVLITSAAHSGENIGKKCVYVTAVPSDFERTFFTGELLNIRCNDETLSHWVYFFFRSAGGFVEIQNAVSGVHLTSGRAKEMAVPLAPLNEQRRIVAKLEELLSRVDAAQARLAIIPRILKRFRQSVLAAACSGRLTAEWREENPHESIGLPIESGKRPLPAIGEEEVLFEKPPSWRWCRLGSLASFINGDRGKNYPNKNEYVPEGIPFINTGHIQPDGGLSSELMHYLTRDKYDSLGSGKIKKGDLVYCLRGATLGKTALVDPYDEGAIASSLVIIRPNEIVDRKFAYYFLTSPYGKELVDRFDNGSAQPNLSADSVKHYVVALPPLPEQQEIVRRVEALFKTANALEARYRTAKAHVDKLTQSILAKAFRGELVPQDPNDEPASVLLERIRPTKDRPSVKKRGARR